MTCVLNFDTFDTVKMGFWVHHISLRDFDRPQTCWKHLSKEVVLPELNVVVLVSPITDVGTVKMIVNALERVYTF